MTFFIDWSYTPFLKVSFHGSYFMIFRNRPFRTVKQALLLAKTGRFRSSNSLFQKASEIKTQHCGGNYQLRLR